MSIQLTEKQQEFFDMVNEDALQSVKNKFVLKGYAGTGKTFLLANLLQKSNFENILAVAPTVMARTQLQTKLPRKIGSKTKINYTTLSKLIEVPKEVITVWGNEYVIDKKGTDELISFLTRMKINTDDLISTIPIYKFDENTGRTIKTEEVKYLLDDNLLRSRVDKQYKGSGAKLIGEVKPSFDYLPTRDIAEKIKNHDLIMIDEMSMVGEASLKVLLDAVKHLNDYYEKNGTTYGKANPTVVMAGDPGQLPPVEEQLNSYFADESNDFDDAKFAVLDKILRSGDEIANVAKLIRRGMDPKIISQAAADGLTVDYDLEEFIRKNQDVLKTVDSALTYQVKNTNRLNNAIRESKGYKGSSASVGETLIVLENTVPDSMNNVEFSNGETYKVVKKYSKEESLAVFDEPMYERLKQDTALVEEAAIAIELDKVEYAELENKLGIRKHAFMFKDLFTKNDMSYKRMKEWFKNLAQQVDGLNPLVIVDFGYARTIHKSQGSEWDDVLLWLTAKDVWIMKKTNPTKWWSLLYTGFTRGAKRSRLYYSSKW